MNDGRAEEENQLKKLREENAERWNRLKELHRQHHDTDGQPSLTPADMLQVEIDLLPQSELFSESDRIIDEISQKNYAEQHMDEYDDELVESYHQLRQTNAILTQRIHRERSRLTKLQDFMDRHKHILLGMQHMKTEQQEGMDVEEEPPDNQQLKAENDKLKNDLKYVADCLQKKIEESSDNSASSQTQTEGKLSLDELILGLINRLQNSAEDPYLSVDSEHIDAKHVACLRKCFAIETKDNTDLIQLTDYRD